MKPFRRSRSRSRSRRRSRYCNGRPSPSRLYRNRRKGRVMGVCAGLADYFGIDPLPLRILAGAGLFFFTVPTLVAYFIAGWVLEDAPDDMFENEAEKKFWRNVRTEPRGTTRDLRHKFRENEERLRTMEAHVTSSEFELNRKFRGLDD